MATKTNIARPARVTCSEQTIEAPSLAAAFTKRAEIETLGACRAYHYVEVLYLGEWVGAHIGHAHELLATPTGTEVKSLDGSVLTVASRSWAVGADEDAVIAGTVSATKALLTDDGRPVVSDWCGSGCTGCANGGQWVRYERWTAEGRVAHGFVCPVTRKITQTG